MGLTYKSTGKDTLAEMYRIDKEEGQFVIALAGNPNTGKSTVFNHLQDFISIQEIGQEKLLLMQEENLLIMKRIYFS